MVDAMSALAQVAGLLPLIALVLLAVLISYWASRSDREANERAERLVSAVLSEEERQQLLTAGYLSVPSPSHPGRVYRVPSGTGMVEILERGRCVERLCVQSMEQIPQLEIVLVHKLMIEGNEQEYLEKANHFPCYY